VLPALQPELYSFTQDFLNSGEGAEELTEITLHGMNLREGAEIYLLSPETGENHIPPLAYHPAGESARLVFETLPPGPYRVHIRNPGGLESSLEITLEPPPALAAAGQAVSDEVPAEPSPPAESPESVPAPKTGFYLSVEYAPLIPLYGYLFDFFDHAVYPLGFSLRIGFMPFRQAWGDLGLELVPRWSMLKAGGAEAQLGSLHLNGVYQKWLSNRIIAFTARLGAGISAVYGSTARLGAGTSTAYSSNNGQDSIFTWMVSANGGLFFRWFIERIQNFGKVSYYSLYIEIGAEYTHIFSTDLQPGYIKPSVGLGWRF
jgi:hypothetical protein